MNGFCDAIELVLKPVSEVFLAPQSMHLRNGNLAKLLNKRFPGLSPKHANDRATRYQTGNAFLNRSLVIFPNALELGNKVRQVHVEHLHMWVRPARAERRWPRA